MVTMYQDPTSPLSMLDLMTKWVARTLGVKVTVHVEGLMGESTTVIDGRMPSLSVGHHSDEHVAWAKYVCSHEKPTRIVLCDSDKPGAFRLYRRPQTDGAKT